MSGNSEQLSAVGAALRNGDRDAAWKLLRPLVSFPTGSALSDHEWAQALGMFELVGSGQMQPTTQAALVAARNSATDVTALVSLAQELTGFDLPKIAASALARANRAEPDNSAILSNLATSLEAAGLYQPAFEILRDSYVARKTDWTTRYHFALTAILAGRTAAARQAFADLGDPATREQILSDPVEAHARLGAILARVDQLRSASPLDEGDLRGWHYVIGGGVLTHVSPHGLDQGMNGRYAVLKDQDGLVHEGVVRAVAVLRSWGMRPAQLVASTDEASLTLAELWRQRIGIPVKTFDPGDTERPALFLAYDLKTASADFLEAMEQRRPDQVLVSHAQRWTQPQAFAADITTLLYQHNTPPAHEAAGPSQTAARIITAGLDPSALADIDELATFAQACGSPQPGHRPPLFAEGPVSSRRF